MWAESLLRGVQEWWRACGPLRGKIIASLLVVGLVLIVRALSLRVVKRRVGEVSEIYLWRRRITYLLTGLLAVALAWVWSEALHSLTTLLSLVGAAVVLALRDVIMNMAGWLFIHWRRPFYIGDRIAVSGMAGDVIDIRLFQFTIVEVGAYVDADQSTGRIIHLPNAKVLTEPIVNYTKDFSYIWNEVGVVITFESNWEKAKSILSAIASEQLPDVTDDARSQLNKAAERYMIFFRTLTPIVYTKVVESGIKLTLRYLTHPRRRRTTEHKIYEAILAQFAEHSDIDFAYPTIRYYRSGEGRPGAQEPSGRDLRGQTGESVGPK